MKYDYALNKLLSILDNQLEQNSEIIYNNYNKYVEQPELGFYAKKNDFLVDNLQWWNYVVENIKSFGINTSLISSNDLELLKERFIFFIWDIELAQIKNIYKLSAKEKKKNINQLSAKEKRKKEKEKKKNLKEEYKRLIRSQENISSHLKKSETIDNRNFSAILKNELWEMSGGYCSICSVKMTPFKGHPNSFEADHIIAYINGGSTSLYNGQALCRSCNRKKSKN